MKHLKINNIVQGLTLSREESERREMYNSKRFDKSRLKCFIFQKPDHFMKDRPKKEDNEGFIHIFVSSNEDNYGSVYALLVSNLEIEYI